jgi:hypothetical protein
MYVYTIADSDEIWGEGNSCTLLTITDTSTGETRTAADFTYFEEEEVAQEELAFLFASM